MKVGDVIIGIHYERPDGVIVMTCGYNALDKLVSWGDNDGDQGEATLDEFKTWKERRDLNDFPNSKDPVLPYDFDLVYDMKNLSQLKPELVSAHSLIQMAIQHGYITKDWDGGELDGPEVKPS